MCGEPACDGDSGGWCITTDDGIRAEQTCCCINEHEWFDRYKLDEQIVINETGAC